MRDEVTVIGFGYTQPGEAESEAVFLQEVDVTYLPNDQCEQAKDPELGESYQDLITDDMLCANDISEDACQGDSGGPLVLKLGAPNVDLLVGVVSWYVSGY